MLTWFFNIYIFFDTLDFNENLLFWFEKPDPSGMSLSKIFIFRLSKETSIHRDLIQSIRALKVSDFLMYFFFILFSRNIFHTKDLLLNFWHWLTDLSDILFVHVKRCVYMSLHVCVEQCGVSSMCCEYWPRPVLCSDWLLSLTCHLLLSCFPPEFPSGWLVFLWTDHFFSIFCISLIVHILPSILHNSWF